MKKTHLISLLMILSLAACKDNKKSDSVTETETIESTPHSDESSKESSNNKLAKEFSWDDLTRSNIDIGAYPYITAPKGMIIDKDQTESFEFDRLEMYDGSTFFVLEGKVERISIRMDGDKDWQQYLFDKSVSEYLKSIGATLIFEGKIPDELTQKWGEDPNAIYKHMHDFYAGDVVNEPIDLYVLKTADKKIGFQVSRHTIGVIELTNFEQTIEKITADDILDEINNKGYATLHINFDTGKSRIKAESYDVVNEIVKMMKANTDLKISIEGHTDNTGEGISNMKLSKNRAKSVLLALTDEDIDESRLVSEGFGQTKPVGDNTTEEGRSMNRRVELRKM